MKYAKPSFFYSFILKPYRYQTHMPRMKKILTGQVCHNCIQKLLLKIGFWALQPCCYDLLKSGWVVKVEGPWVYRCTIKVFSPESPGNQKSLSSFYLIEWWHFDRVALAPLLYDFGHLNFCMKFCLDIPAILAKKPLKSQNPYDKSKWTTDSYDVKEALID